MSAVIRSNARTGLYAAKAGRSLATSAQDVIDDYVSRVAAGGGTINSLSRVEDDIRFLHSEGLIGAMGAAISAEYGLKVDGINIQQAFSLDGLDMFPRVTVFGFGEGVEYDTSGPVPFIVSRSQAGGRYTSLETKEAQTAAAGYRGGLAIISAPSTPASAYGGLYGGIGSGEATPTAQITRTATGVVTTAISSEGVSQTITESRYGPDSAALSGYCTYFDTQQMWNLGFRDGVEIETPWSRSRLKDDRYVSTPRIASTPGAALTVPVAGNLGRTLLFWWFRDLTIEQAAKVSGYLGERYS